MTVDAQILYTNVDPDHQHLGGAGGVSIDLDQDSIPDFYVFASDTIINLFEIKRTKVRPLNSNGEIAGTMPTVYNYALALDAYSMIDTVMDWNGATNTMAFNLNGANPYNEQWNGVQDKYLALRVKAGPYYYYGWARLDVGLQGDFFVLKDFAIETVPNTPIYAGDKGLNVGLSETAPSEILIQQKGRTLTLEANDQKGSGTIELYNLQGQLLQTQTWTGTKVNLHLGDIAGGMYILKAHFGDAHLNQKVFIR